MRVEDCSKDGRTCPECNYVSHTTSDLMYHVARVHDFVLDYLPPHVKEKVVGLERHKARPEEDEDEEEKEEGTKTTKEVAVSLSHITGLGCIADYNARKARCSRPPARYDLA